MFRWSYGHNSKCATFPWCCILNVLHTQKVCVRRMKNFLRASKVKVFAKNLHILSLKLCQAPEYSIILYEFLAKTLTSEARRNFSMRRTHMFWVCKTCYSTGSEKWIALWIMTIRPTKHFLFDKVSTPTLFPAVWTPFLYIPRRRYQKSSVCANFECQKNLFETLNQKSAPAVLSGLIRRPN